MRGQNCALFIIYVPNAPSLILSISQLVIEEGEVVEKERERNSHFVYLRSLFSNYLGSGCFSLNAF